LSNPTPDITIIFRIPGSWAHPRELVQRLPSGCRLTGETLEMPDGSSVEFGAMPPDNLFANIFRSSCRLPAREEELAIVDAYTVNITLCGPGGSLEAARKMMRAASVILRAGGAGVFIDNSTVAMAPRAGKR
jgi:hypothetical protein